MVEYGKWIAVVGGVIAVIGQFVSGMYLALVGGVVAVVGGFLSK